ncbi:MAG: hypothetical protein Q4D55_09240, partial [Eubacteriales bacterium]|nr:hypothetical protein [Eubacteriales bacterium]
WKHFAFLCNFDVAFESHKKISFLLKGPRLDGTGGSCRANGNIPYALPVHNKGQYLMNSNTAQTVGQNSFYPTCGKLHGSVSEKKALLLLCSLYHRERRLSIICQKLFRSIIGE